MKGTILWLLGCLLVLLSTVNGLGEGEKSALEEILFAFPSLASINPIDQYDDFDNDWGGSWTKPTAEICSNGDGWDVQGIHCRGTHVDAIRFSASFGKLVGTLPDLSGLIQVTNLSVAPIVTSIFPDIPSANLFLEALLGIESLRSVEIKDWPITDDFPLTALESANLTHVSLSLPSITVSFSNMSFLEAVYLEQEMDNCLQFVPSALTLRSLVLPQRLHGLDGISNLTSLEELEIETSRSAPTPDFDVFPIPRSLKSLKSSYWGGFRLALGDEYSQLESLSIYMAAFLTHIDFLPPNLTRLSIQGINDLTDWDALPMPCYLESFSMTYTTKIPIPNRLHECKNLKTLSFTGIGNASLDALLNQSFNDTALESLAIEYAIGWPNPENLTIAQEWLCTIPLSLKRLSLRETFFTELPSCISDFESLESLDVSVIKLNPSDSMLMGNVTVFLKELTTSMDAIGHVTGSPTIINWEALVNRFPMLTKLEVSRITIFPSPFPGNPIKRLTSLETLVLNGLGLTGSLPTDFFDILSKLKICNLNFNALSGTIPNGFFADLVRLELGWNQFSAWHAMNVSNSSPLASIQLGNNRLETIPADEVFQRMTKLRSLALISNAGFTLPTFWTTGQHALRLLVASNSQMTGSLPTSIRSPYLRYLQLQNNQLCGSLPEISAPSSLLTLDLSSNRFTGSIPSSWGHNLTTRSLRVANNRLSGEISLPLLSTHSQTNLFSLALQNNYFTGLIPNLTRFTNLGTFLANGVNSTFDFCTEPPALSPSLYSCSLTFHPSICHCESSYTICKDGEMNVTQYCSSSPEAFSEPYSPPSVSSIRTPIVPPIESCPYMPPQPPQEGCPLPSPGSSFYCDNGIWKSRGSVTQPTLTVPGSSQPGTTTTIIIEGNLTVTQGGVTFNGFESQVVVNGCIFLGDNQVTIELTKEELEKLAKEGKISKTLLSSLGENGCLGSSDLSETKVVVTKGVGSKGCRKVKALNNGSSKSSLTVVFNIDNSTCNMIIIIPSVIGGIIMLAGVAVAIGLYLRHLRLKSPARCPPAH